MQWLTPPPPFLLSSNPSLPARRYLPPETQVVLVSATLPHDVLEMTSKFMTDPVRVLVKRDELTLEVRFMLCMYIWSQQQLG